MGKIADPLREYIKSRDWSNRETDGELSELVVMADGIDRDHEWRMEQCRRETKRAFARYIRSVINDYMRGVKRTVPRRAQAWPVGSGRYYCTQCDEPIIVGQRYCASCGARIKWPMKEVDK